MQFLSLRHFFRLPISFCKVNLKNGSAQKLKICVIMFAFIQTFGHNFLVEICSALYRMQMDSILSFRCSIEVNAFFFFAMQSLKFCALSPVPDTWKRVKPNNFLPKPACKWSLMLTQRVMITMILHPNEAQNVFCAYCYIWWPMWFLLGGVNLMVISYLETLSWCSPGIQEVCSILWGTAHPVLRLIYIRVIY